MKKILTRLSSILLLVTIVISAITMSGHVFAQTDRQNQNNIVDVETDENQSTKVILQSSEESLEPTAGKTADSEQTKSSEENTTDSEVQQNSEENSNEQPENSLFSDRLRPSDTLTAGSLEIEDTRSLSKYDTVNTLKDFTYTVSFSNLTPEKIYKYQTTSNTKYFTAESDGTATLQIVLRANQTVTFSDVANASYTITTSENAASAASYTATTGAEALKKPSGQAGIGSPLSSERETVSATSGTVFTFNHQFYYDFVISSTVKSASEISPSAHLVFPASMKGQSIQIEGTSNSVTVGEDLTADITVADGQEIILSDISSSNIDQMYDSSELISIPDISGYTSSLTKHIEDNGDITANINYKEYGYQIIYHGNGADDELTETVVDDDIQNTYSFSTKDTSSSHYLYVDLTRNGNTMNYKITLSPIGVMYLKNREGTITVNGVKKSVMLNAPAGKISEIDSGSFEINDTGDTYFSCSVEAKKTHLMTSNWTADFGNNKLGTRTKFEVSKIIDNLTYSEVKNLHANPYTKTGYLFTGWNTRADGTGTGYTETQKISQLAAADKDEDSIDLYAQWIPVQYSVKYSGNGATGGSMSNSSYIYDQTGTLAQNQFEKNYTLTFKYNYSGTTDSTLVSKYKFNGWNGSDGKKYADKAAVKNLTSKNNDVITMTAQWTPASVTLPSPSRNGYTFDGWYSAASGGNKVGSAGDSVTPESNKTYYAHWSANNYTYKIRYISSSGKLLSEDTVSGNFDSERTVTPPLKNGYTTPAVQKVVFDSVSAKTITFTYEPVKYSITYDLQGGSATGNPASYTIESSAITLNAPSKSKHDFTGWSGTGILGKQATVTIPSGSTGNKTYTANWHSNEVTYTVKYVSSSGLSLGTSSVAGTIGTSSKVSAPSKNGYTVPATQTVAFEDTSKTVTFIYVPIDYTITCDVNGGNPLSNQKTNYNIESSAITLPLPTCKGMEFIGWTGSNGTDSQKTVTIAKGSTGNKSYTANWNTIAYTITYDLNGGYVSGNPSSFTVDSSDITLNNPTKLGATFKGWTGSNGNTPQTSVKIEKGSIGNRKYTANWTVNMYYIDLNGKLDGIGSTTLQNAKAEVVIDGKVAASGVTDYYKQHPYGAEYKITVTADEGYTIKQSVYSGVVGTGNVTVTPEVTTNSYTNTISHWAWGFENKEGNNNDYKTAFRLKDKTFVKKYGETVTYTENEAIEIPNGFFLNSGFGSSSYEGHWSDEEAKKHWKTYQFGKSFTQPAYSTFAEYDYSPVAYNITYNLDGGTNSKNNPETYNVLYGVKFEDPTRDGYTFEGWYISDKKVDGINDGADATFSSTDDLYEKLKTRVIGDVTVTAKWKPITYTIEFDSNDGSGTTVTQNMIYDQSSDLSSNTYTRPKYRFLYWTLNPDGSGIRYKDKTSVKNLTSTSRNIKLYAQWEKLTDFKIKNTVSGNMGNKAKNFTFTASFPDSFRGQTISVINGSGNNETVTVDSNNSATFSLKHGETYTFMNLSKQQANDLSGILQRVVSETDYRSEGYETLVSSEIEADGTLVLSFRNTRNTGVPTGLHLGDASLWMTLVGVLGVIGIAISKILNKKE